MPSSKVSAMRLAQELSSFGSFPVPTADRAAACSIATRCERDRSKFSTTRCTPLRKSRWDANGSSFQIRSSNVQPSARDALTTPDSTPSNDTVAASDQPYGHASLAGIPSVTETPPDNRTVLVSIVGTLAATSTTTRIGG